MEYTRKPVICIVVDCDEVAALSSIAEDQFHRFTTYYCSTCYQKMLAGEELVIQSDRIIIERRALALG